MLDIILQSLISSLIGFVWLCTIFFIVQKVNINTAAIIGGIPSTILISLFFITITSGKQIAIDIIDKMPIILVGTYVLFIALNFLMLIWNFVQSLFTSLILWIVFTVIVSTYNKCNFTVNIAVSYVIVLILYYFLNKIKLKNLVVKIKYTNTNIIGRAFFAGIMIGAIVFFSKVFGTTIGSIFASFPAVLVSCLVIINQSYGANIMIAMGRTLLHSSFFNITLYILALRYMYLSHDVIISTITSIFCVIIINILFIKLNETQR